MISLDLQDAYLQVPDHRDSRRYLRFVVQGQTYQFRVLYFGLTTAPQVFTRIMAPVSPILHEYEVRMLCSLDDWLILVSSELACLQSRGQAPDSMYRTWHPGQRHEIVSSSHSITSVSRHGDSVSAFLSSTLSSSGRQSASSGRGVLVSSEDNMISKLSVGEKLGKSDRNMIRFEILTSFTKLEKSFMKPNFRKADFSRLRCEIRRLPKSGGTDAEQNWFSFKTKFMKAQSCCIPQRKITPNGTKQPEWFNKSIAEAISNRQKAYNISKLRPSPETKVAHIKECRNVDKLIRRAKLNEEDRVAAAAKDNPKAFFAHVNNRKPVKNTIGPLKDRTGSIISSDEGMANILNEYFVSVYTEEDTSEIPVVPIVYRGNNPLRKIEITVDKVKMKLKKLNSNKSAGPDGFYPRVIKETEEETAPHFCNIFRTSLEQRKAVRDWKLQNISPLFKKGSKDDPRNYRPISLTSVPGKMLESIIADDMISHLEHNKLILDSQHGFRSGKSCLTNLVDFFHDMFSIYDKSRAVDILFQEYGKPVYSYSTNPDRQFSSSTSQHF